MSFPKVIVSMTSYPARFEAAAKALEPLFRQSVSPDSIQLWLAEDEVSSKNDLPGSLADLERAGLEIKWCKRSLKPHNKYFWAMQENPGDIIVTIDDDIVYPLSLLQDLLEAHYRHPEAVIARRTHLVTRSSEGAIAPYQDWTLEQTDIRDVPRHDLLATGVGGVLYPPGIFDRDVFDERDVRDTSLMADDLWLLIHELRLGVSVVSTDAYSGLTYVGGTQEDGLYLENLVKGRNNEILRALFKRYPESENLLHQAISERESQTASAGDDREGAGIARRAARRLLGR